jgi:predicted double-glycine peptidase
VRALLFLAFSLLLTPAAWAGSVVIPGADSGTLNVKVMSLKERQFRLTVRQKLDFSCGSAALSTLLTYHYGDPVDEPTIFKAMWDNGDHQKIRREGFSLLDLKHFLEARGYSADGYAAPLERLESVGIPAIVLIRENGYNHFVVVKGIRDGKVAVGDPSLGARVYPLQQFEKMMANKIVFVINGLNQKAVFNDPRDWRVREKAPISLATNPTNMINSTLLRRPVGDF